MTQVPLADVEPRPRRVAVGEFDGVHLGHREVIAGSGTVLTFDPHPLAVIRPEAAPRLLTSTAAKVEILRGLGVDEVVVIPFDQRFAAQTAQEFIDHVLIERLGATHVSVGENFRFGHRAGGDTELLGAQDRFETRVVPLVEVDGEIVSSSHIRGLLLAGEVRHAADFLGRPFQMSGTVVDGDKRGRKLGFPTANLVPNEAYLCPGHGVYACRAFTEGGPSRGYMAATNIGVRPTFGTGRGVLIEAYLLDFNDDLYGAPLRLDLIARLRGERRFASIDVLVEQMHQDAQRVRELLEGE